MDIAIIPKALLYRLGGDPEGCIHLNVLLSHLLLLIGAALAICFSVDLSVVPHVCLFDKLFGIPCPGCGLTRSLFALFVGDIHYAWTLNPAGPMLGTCLVAQLPLRIMALRMENWSRRAFGLSRIMTTGILITLFVNWIYQII